MKVYIVTEVCDEEYGCTANSAVFASREDAEKYVAENQYTWHPWWRHEDDEDLNGFSIEEWEVK